MKLEYDLPDDVVFEAKVVADRRKTTLNAVVEDALRTELYETPELDARPEPLSQLAAQVAATSVAKPTSMVQGPSVGASKRRVTVAILAALAVLGALVATVIAPKLKAKSQPEDSVTMDLAKGKRPNLEAIRSDAAAMEEPVTSLEVPSNQSPPAPDNRESGQIELSLNTDAEDLKLEHETGDRIWDSEESLGDAVAEADVYPEERNEGAAEGAAIDSKVLDPKGRETLAETDSARAQRLAAASNGANAVYRTELDDKDGIVSLFYRGRDISGNIQFHTPGSIEVGGRTRPQQYELKGKFDEASGNMILERVAYGEPRGNLNLGYSKQDGKVHWSGTLAKSDGSKMPFKMVMEEKTQKKLEQEQQASAAASRSAGESLKSKLTTQGAQTTSEYQGWVGKSEVRVRLSFLSDGKVSGFYSSLHSGKTYKLEGQNKVEGNLRLEEFTLHEDSWRSTAKVELKKTLSEEAITWSGMMKNHDGRNVEMRFSKSR